MLIRHFSFLRTVFLYSISAFGGPAGAHCYDDEIFCPADPLCHRGRADGVQCFCQLLPGASVDADADADRVQTGRCAAGGADPDYLDPARLPADGRFFIPGALYRSEGAGHGYFQVYWSDDGRVSSMPVYRLFLMPYTNTITWVIVIISAGVTYLFFRQPAIFPALIVLAGLPPTSVINEFRRLNKSQRRSNGGISGLRNRVSPGRGGQ